MLDKLCKQDARWRNVAFVICKDKDLADDLVQEMYIRVINSGYTKTNSTLIYRIITNLFINYCRDKKECRLSEEYYLSSNDSRFEPDDQEQEMLDKIKELEWQKQELLAESYDRSLREIEAEYNINYAYTHRQLKETRKIVLNGKKQSLLRKFG